jgi:hypothetical protein
VESAPDVEPEAPRRAPLSHVGWEDVVRAQADSVRQAVQDSIRLDDLLRRLEFERLDPLPPEEAVPEGEEEPPSPPRIGW